MAFGNMGKVAEIDLTTGKVEELELPFETYRDYVGGTGLAARLIYERGNLEAEPLDPENVLVLAAGPLTGIGFSGSSRMSAGARSPLTGIWGQASCGGNFGPELKRCGYDALVIKGKSPEPVYLVLETDSIKLAPARDLWGKDTYQAIDVLKERHGRQYRVLAVGPAAENGVLFGSIVNDYGHHFGRTGMGTVMASKNLKAVVARGEKEIPLKDPERLRELREKYDALLEKNGMARALRAFGTACNMEGMMVIGDVPTRNWGVGIWEEGGEKLSGISLDDQYIVTRRSCRGCAVRCKPVIRVEEEPYTVEEGPGPEYETLGAFGTMLMNSNLAAVCKINELCNRFGMDTITCGATIAWAMDCFEAGIMNPSDWDGIELRFGDIDTVIALIPKIAHREGKLGELLSMGSRKASGVVGEESKRFLTDTKGLEAPMHDPRAYWGDGLAYAISVRGACHVSNLTYLAEWGIVRYPEIKMDKHYHGMSAEHKADMVAKATDMGCLFNSMVWCQFAGTTFTLPLLRDVFNAAADYQWDIEEMVKAGGRIWYLQRALGHIWGATADDDALGPRLMTPTPDGNIAGIVPDMDTMLREFYQIRRLREDGKPTREALRDYGLEYLADRLGV